MFRQRHEARYALPTTAVFECLLQVLARRRWAGAGGVEPAAASPPLGQRYVHRNGTVVRRGRVVECSKPVLLTLYESLVDAPCRVRLRLRWRLEPIDGGTSVLLDARYELNGPAYLNRAHWREEIHGHCERLLAAVRRRIADGGAQDQLAVSGQKIGSSTMTVTNTTAVNGRPTLK